MLTESEKNELRELLNEHLKHGDKTEVARQAGVTVQTVSNVISEFDLESPVMDALIAKAEENKQTGLSKKLSNISKIKKLKN